MPFGIILDTFKVNLSGKRMSREKLNRSLMLFTLVLIFFVHYPGNVHGVNVTAPVNTATRLGRNTNFSCSVQGASSISLDWYEFTSDIINGLLLSKAGSLWSHEWAQNGLVELQYEKDDLNLVVRSELTIIKTELEFGGKYGCQAPEVPQIQPRFAYLLVVDKVTCPILPGPVLEGEQVNLECDVNHSGPWSPNVTWVGYGTSDLVLTAMPALNMETFTCSVTYSAPPPNLTPGSNFDKSAPEYEDNCSLRLTVHYAPRYQTVNSSEVKDFYREGDFFACEADSNPSATYYWVKNTGSGQVFVDGDTLRVTQEMVGENNYTCVAENIVNSSNKTVFFIVVSDDEVTSIDVGSVVGGVIGGLVVIGAIIIVAVYLLRRKPDKMKDIKRRIIGVACSSSKGHTERSNEKDTSAGSTECSRYSKDPLASNKTTEEPPTYEDGDMDRWEVEPSQVTRHNLLGSGSFGQVFFGEATDLPDLPGITAVAVKMIKDSADGQDKKEFLQEAEVMKILPKHYNVVSLLGCCTLQEPLMILVEYMPNGNLKDYLKQNRSHQSSPYGNIAEGSESFAPRDLLSYAWQTARGMEHLSKHDLLHRDLAARNVLVGIDNVCKISDFGFARDIVDKNVYHKKSAGPLPIRWMAPESIFDNTYTTKSDVWSFGILLWEIVTLGANPYPGLSGRQVIHAVRTKNLMERPEHCSADIHFLMTECWSESPDKRPSFTEIARRLGEMLQDESDYLDLSTFQENIYSTAEAVSFNDEKI